MANNADYDKSSHVFQSKILNGVFNPYTDTIIYDGGLVVEEEGDEKEVIVYDGGNLED